MEESDQRGCSENSLRFLDYVLTAISLGTKIQCHDGMFGYLALLFWNQTSTWRGRRLSRLAILLFCSCMKNGERKISD
jgi:hypothetical protein